MFPCKARGVAVSIFQVIVPAEPFSYARAGGRGRGRNKRLKKSWKTDGKANQRWHLGPVRSGFLPESFNPIWEWWFGGGGGRVRNESKTTLIVDSDRRLFFRQLFPALFFFSFQIFIFFPFGRSFVPWRFREKLSGLVLGKKRKLQNCFIRP